jgi:hypothetical protein
MADNLMALNRSGRLGGPARLQSDRECFIQDYQQEEKTEKKKTKSLTRLKETETALDRTNTIYWYGASGIGTVL